MKLWYEVADWWEEWKIKHSRPSKCNHHWHRGKRVRSIYPCGEGDINLYTCCLCSKSVESAMNPDAGQVR